MTITVGAEPRKHDLYPGEIVIDTSQQGLKDFPAFVLESWGSLGGSDRDRLDFARQFTIDDDPASATRKDGSDLSVDDADADPQMEAVGKINPDNSDMTADASLAGASETPADGSATSLRSPGCGSMLLSIAA